MEFWERFLFGNKESNKKIYRRYGVLPLDEGGLQFRENVVSFLSIVSSECQQIIQLLILVPRMKGKVSRRTRPHYFGGGQLYKPARYGALV